MGGQPRRGPEHLPLWVTAVTLGLVLAGFAPHRSATSRRSDDGHTPSADRLAREEPDRGRLADRPSELPTPGWRDVLLRVYRRIGDDRTLAIAAGVTFYAMLAIVPALAALISVYGLFADPPTIERHLDALTFLPGEAVQIIRDQMHRLAAQDQATLGISFVVGLALSLWSANAGIKALFDALNVVYQEKEKRGFFKLNALSLAFTAGLIAFLLLAMGAIVAVPAALRLLPMPEITAVILHLARWPLLLVAFSLLLSLLYRCGPSRDAPRWRWVSWGSVIAAVLWIGTSSVFSWYAANFASYNKTYGSLGAVIAFMTWMWISTVVVLLGAQINAEMEHQTIRDTTQGRPRPMGTRGATMADTVGRAQR